MKLFETKDQRIGLLLLTTIFLVSVTGFSATSSLAAGPSLDRACTIPAAPANLERLLCAESFEPTRIQIEFNRLRNSRDANERSLAADLLVGIWRKDRRFKGMPWHQFEYATTRANVAQELAPIVRAGDPRVSLKELQDFAMKFSRSDGRPPNSQGIELLGDTGAGDQEQFFRGVLENAKMTENLKLVAIVAMGKMCDDGTERLLHALVKGPRDQKRRDYVMASIARRHSTPVLDWCKRAASVSSH